MCRGLTLLLLFRSTLRGDQDLGHRFELAAADMARAILHPTSPFDVVRRDAQYENTLKCAIVCTGNLHMKVTQIPQSRDPSLLIRPQLLCLRCRAIKPSTPPRTGRSAGHRSHPTRCRNALDRLSLPTQATSFPTRPSCPRASKALAVCLGVHVDSIKRIYLASRSMGKVQGAFDKAH